MRAFAPLALAAAMGCASTLYGHFAGPAAGTADEAYACVQSQLKTLGYSRTQYKEETRWFVAQKNSVENNSSGLYRQTQNVLDTKVNIDKNGAPSLDIKARTFDTYATAKGDDRQERKASDRVQLDAKALGQACAAQ